MKRARPLDPLADWCVARIEGVCQGRACHRHHILRRSQGGSDGASNTADLCGACHDHIHGHVAWSYANGWLRRRGGAQLGLPHPNQTRYWPTGENVPRLEDGTVDIRALCRMYDEACNP